MDKLLYLGLSIQDIGKIAMYEYRYDYIKQSMTTSLNFATWTQHGLLNLYL